ncbi:TlyA family RNA methyltransferase [Microbacterium thalassium]|uniref:23S rRNA (Cytidine1920-2'-O)/16S rRNA (Cytidine1409-2'-O)-methyltransferase n=1 Tax=Microbacterium thalassium TaxID=362649 RepID=A0A7X0KUW1_9MICO|nr:TlyA family RNA methyltransferase [Microbacterium thalassium]MBB6391576.1 23S rRNA (cytidine1920-2'-O)/16S rRNA (cytidine1409-2'-O)-methyltransferase [Microbacterium thalassium]GLK24179.1 TlyA family rRNA (cytidine-2'-O)-methyltransferase [Microbacterium thalassium]
MSERLDAALAARGLARSRTHAAALIAGGLVTVDGRGVVKASAKVGPDAVLDVAGADHYVSRAAHKLIAGLDAFGVAVERRVALDMGASTGGFTQVLRERGADPVIAVDVGHGQLAPAIAADPGVIAIEGFNVRYMTPESLAAASGVETPPSVITGDLSFISLTHVLPAARAVAASDADLVLLVKPQFEVGRTAVKGGLVTDPATRSDAVMGVLWAAWDGGLGTCGVISSPILGTHGNAEYIAHLAPGRGSNPTEWSGTVNELTGST